MGEGNDKLEVEGNIIGGRYQFDMGNGNNIIHIKKSVNDTVNLVLSFGDGNDLLRVDKNFDGQKNINFGEGQNKLVARDLLMGNNNSINYGSGDDVLLVSNRLAGNSGAIDMGDGNNTVKVGGNFNGTVGGRGSITTGEGNDVFRFNGSVNGDITAGAGEDSIRIDNDLSGGTIDTGAKATDTVASDNDYIRIDGTAGALTNAISINTAAQEGYQGTDDDTVRIDSDAYGNITVGGGNDTIQIGGIYRGDIEASSGDNSITIDGTFQTGSITTGDGVDTIQIDGDLANITTNSPSVITGAGNDSLTIGGEVRSGRIDMGDGDDVLYIQGPTRKGMSDNSIDMGAGDDTVMLQGGNETYYAKHFQNVNTFDMTEDTKQTLELQIDDILNDDVEELFIKGDDLDVVDLGANGNGLSDNKIGRENGVWSQKNELHTDSEGNTYHAYIFTGNDGSVNNEIVYIQDVITVI